MADEIPPVESVPVVMPDQAVAAQTQPPQAPPPEPEREVITDRSVGQNIDVTA